MPVSGSSAVKEYRKKVKQAFTLNDTLFLFLRLITIVGCSFWLVFAPLDRAITNNYFLCLAFFSTYSLLLYLLIFFNIERIRHYYLLSLLPDILFISWWVSLTNRFDNSFFLGYYLLVVLHTLHFGYLFGLLVATLATILYFNNLLPFWQDIHWTEPGLRAAFLYLIGIPAGLIHGELRRDKDKIEKLNIKLSESLTNLQRMQKKLIESEKLSALGRMTAGIAHEIRNPLSALGGLSRRLLKRLPGETNERRYAEVIVSEVTRLEAILRDFILFTKTSQHFARAILNDTVRVAVSRSLELYKNDSPLKLVEEYGENVPLIFQDPEQIALAINNLICNALDSMPSGGSLTIETGVESINRITWGFVTIRDTGQGISQQQSPFIFEPFFSTKRIGTGTGLGLIIVHEIMNDHRGFVRLSSTEGQGTTVTLYFPHQAEVDDSLTPCWKFLRCGIERDPTRRCPAYPYFGRICWGIAGTFCEGRVCGTFAEKIADCTRCTFYGHCQRPPAADSPEPAQPKTAAVTN